MTWMTLFDRAADTPKPPPMPLPNRRCSDCAVEWRAQHNRDNDCWVCGREWKPGVQGPVQANGSWTMEDERAFAEQWAAAWMAIGGETLAWEEAIDALVGNP